MYSSQEATPTYSKGTPYSVPLQVAPTSPQQQKTSAPVQVMSVSPVPYYQQHPTGNIYHPQQQQQYQRQDYSNHHTQQSIQTLVNPDFTQSEDSVVAHCPSCRFFGSTRIEKTIGTCQLVTSIFMLMSAFCCIPGLILLVCYKDVEHYCARCGNLLGKKEGCC